MQSSMEKVVSYFSDQLLGIHSYSISPSLIDTVKIEYKGSLTPLKIISNTYVKDNRIAIALYDKSLLGLVEKTLKDKGFNAYVFSKDTVVITLSKFNNQEDRQRVINQVNRLSEESKIAIRNIRKKFKQKIDKDSEKELQKITDFYIEKINQITSSKIEVIQK